MPGQEKNLNPAAFLFLQKTNFWLGGRKICGSAQVRKRGGFLQHGSLLLAFDPEKTASLLLPARTWEQLEKLRKAVTAINEELISPVDIHEFCLQLKKGFTDELGIELAEDTATSAEEKLKNELIKKYNDVNWNMNGKNNI